MAFNDKVGLVLNVLTVFLCAACAIFIGITGTVYIPAVVIAFIALALYGVAGIFKVIIPKQ